VTIGHNPPVSCLLFFVTLFLLLLPPCFYIAKCNKRECCCIWLWGPGFQDLDIWLSRPRFQDLDKRTLGFSTSTDARTQQAKLYIWLDILKNMGVITIKQVKNHVKQLKICQFFQTYLCNATLMSFWSRKFVLNDLYKCWRIPKIN
jgi:hypothetical protein